MHTHSFSDAQAAHALDVVLTLMRERRFFLFRQSADSLKIEGDLGHGLDPKVFNPALELDKTILDIYKTTTKMAEYNIANWEQSLGLKAPNPNGNRQIVQCARYTGGLDICRVYPSKMFMALAPATFDELRESEVKRLAGNTAPGDYSPNEMQRLRSQADANAGKIWEEIEAIKALESGNSCVVLLKTRFEPTEGYAENDFLQGRLAGIRLYPHAMGYLFYEYSKRTRIVRHAHVVCSTQRKFHVNVQHWSDKGPSMNFKGDGGYSCKVYIPIVL